MSRIFTIARGVIRRAFPAPVSYSAELAAFAAELSQSTEGGLRASGYVIAAADRAKAGQP